MITLTKDMEVGVPEIDAQHRELIDRLNAVIAMGAKSVTAEETQKTLDLLEDYVAKHFSDEEVIQKESGYLKYEWHKGQHQLYVNEIKKLKQQFLAGGVSSRFTLDMNNSIVKWIVSHIKSVDVELGQYCRTKA